MKQPSVERLLAYCSAVIRSVYGIRPVKIQIVLENGETFVAPIPVRVRPTGRTPDRAKVTRRCHSPDFASAMWKGVKYRFTKIQRMVVRELWRAWENGTPELSQEYLLEVAESSSAKLSDVFSGHPAWGVMIVPGGRGSFQLSD